MAYDILFGHTKRNWARGSHQACLVAVTSVTVRDEVSLRLTKPEMAMLAELSATKLAADAGNPKAKKKLAKLTKKLAHAKKKAQSGDPQAKRTLLVLRESGVFRGVQTMTMGNDLIPHSDYRAVVFKEAMKSAKGRPPTTKDFFKAKKNVDAVMSAAGLSIYLPGSSPGRVTY